MNLPWQYSVDVETRQPVLGTLPRSPTQLMQFLSYKTETKAEAESLYEAIEPQIDFLENPEHSHFGLKTRPEIWELELEQRSDQHQSPALVVDHRWLKTALLNAAEVFFSLAGRRTKSGLKREEYKDALEESIYIEPQFIPLRRREELGNISEYIRDPHGFVDISGQVSSPRGKQSIVSRHDYLLDPLFFNFGVMITNNAVIQEQEFLNLLTLAQRIGVGGARKLDFGNFEITTIIKKRKEGEIMVKDLTDKIREAEQQNYRRFQVEIKTVTPLLGGESADRERIIKDYLSSGGEPEEQEEEEESRDREKEKNVLPRDQKGRPCLKQSQILAMLRDAGSRSGLTQEKRMAGFKTQLREGGLHLDKDKILFLDEEGKPLTEPDGTKIIRGQVRSTGGERRSIEGEHEYIDPGRTAQFTLHVLNTTRDPEVVEDEDVVTLLTTGQWVGLGSVRSEFGEFRVTNLEKLD